MFYNWFYHVLRAVFTTCSELFLPRVQNCFNHMFNVYSLILTYICSICDGELVIEQSVVQFSDGFLYRVHLLPLPMGPENKNHGQILMDLKKMKSEKFYPYLKLFVASSMDLIFSSEYRSLNLGS